MNTQNFSQDGACLDLLGRLKSEIARAVVGQDALVERVLVALLANGHILLEGVPGLAKTRLILALAKCIDCDMSRVQFTPDLLPSDLIGTEVYRPATGEFIIRKGPIFANIVLADEINRAPAKVQSALLQAMQEREVSIGEQTFLLPQPFLVLATQNPIEQEGTYPLPEAQLDRFLMKVTVSYPSFDEEMAIMQMVCAENGQMPELQRVLPIEQLAHIRSQVRQIHVDPRIDRYIVSIIHASRNPESVDLAGSIEWGASPRASISLRLAAQCLAFLRGENFVSPQTVQDIAVDVLRHRILPAFEAEARGITSDRIVQVLLQNVSVP